MVDLAPVASAQTQTATAVMDNSKTCGEALAVGTAVYEKTSGVVWKADASAAATATVFGINMQPTTAASQPCCVQRGGECDLGVACLAGELYYLSATAGGIAPDADIATTNVCSYIGTGNGTNLLMKIDNTGLVHV